ncbi:hypothetical protein WJX72_009282 [[Myrmecia] bisecta]|uniref:RRM domain-containing protein n=1 Tax=[Myrmecia] bisecta TaxID=41462 RepID=A0AAW1PUX3_9CHLO
MGKTSKYVLYVSNLSSATRSADIKKEFSYAGPVEQVERDYKTRSALVELRSERDRAHAVLQSPDAQYAWKKMDGFRLDGRKWMVDWATKDDFKFFGWKWTEDSPSPSR